MDAKGAGRPKAESRIVARVSDYDDKRTTGVFEQQIPSLDKPAANSLVLMIRMNSHRTQPGARYLSDLQRAVHDVTDDFFVERGYQG